MPGADVRIMKQEDPGPLFPEVVEAGFMQILPESEWKVALIEGGMASGKPSVALAIPTPDGRPEAFVIVETSLEILSTIVLSARAAFPQFFDGGPLAVDADQDAMALAQAEALVTVTAGLAHANGVDLHQMAHAIVDMVKAQQEGEG